MEKLHSSSHQIQELLKEYSLLMRGSTKALKYGTVLSTEREEDGDSLDQSRVLEILKIFAAQGSEGYPTPPLCSSDTFLTTSI